MARTDEVWDSENGVISPTDPQGADVLIRGTNKHLNFGAAAGDSGYGFRDSSGVIQVKNSSGCWQPVLIVVSATAPTDPCLHQLWVDIS
jgi:hypothetical protein